MIDAECEDFVQAPVFLQLLCVAEPTARAWLYKCRKRCPTPSFRGQEVTAVIGTYIGAVSCAGASQPALMELPVNFEGEVEARGGIGVSGPPPQVP